MNQESVRGIVIEVRPKALYRVRLEDGRVVTTNLESSLRHTINRVFVNKQVQVRLSQNDPTRGQIIQIASK